MVVNPNIIENQYKIFLLLQTTRSLSEQIRWDFNLPHWVIKGKKGQ